MPCNSFSLHLSWLLKKEAKQAVGSQLLHPALLDLGSFLPCSGLSALPPLAAGAVAGSSVPFSPPHQARGGGRRGNSPFPWAASPTWEQEHPTQRPATRRGFQVLIDKLYTKSSCTQLLTSLHFKKKKETQPKKNKAPKDSRGLRLRTEGLSQRSSALLFFVVCVRLTYHK